MQPDWPQSQAPKKQTVAVVELIISTVLRVGVVSSLSIVVLGTILSFVHHPDYLSSSPALAGLVRPGATFPHTIGDIVNGVRAFHGQAVVALGLWLLIITPVLRVAVSVVVFIYEKDHKFTVFTLIVLALLLLSFFLGRGGQ